MLRNGEKEKLNIGRVSLDFSKLSNLFFGAATQADLWRAECVCSGRGEGLSVSVEEG